MLVLAILRLLIIQNHSMLLVVFAISSTWTLANSVWVVQVILNESPQAV